VAEKHIVYFFRGENLSKEMRPKCWKQASPDFTNFQDSSFSRLYLICQYLIKMLADKGSARQGFQY